jgi:transcriptional regulator with XRE-family HTH domain
MKPEPLYADFGRLVREHRRRFGLTQTQLGERVGLSRTSITNIEQGRQKVLLHQVYLLAESLGATIESLLPHISSSELTLPDLEEKLPKDLTGPEREWVRRVVVPNATGGGDPHADSKD